MDQSFPDIPSYLLQFQPDRLPVDRTRTLVIGSGIAGSRAALEAARFGPVRLLTKESYRESNTNYAQGGIAAPLDVNDSTEAHAKDTIEAARGLGDTSLIQNVVQEGKQLVEELIDWGTRFDRSENEIQLTREGGHSRRRVLHAGGDKTGKELARILHEKVREESNIEVQSDCFAIDLLVEEGECKGVLYQNKNNQLRLLYGNLTILATGGSGQLFRETTNPSIATGDGAAMAFRAGVPMENFEFFQFHPTTLYVAGSGRTLISEAVRGEGAKLVNRDGKRFMQELHPDGELAPRDVVSRGIVREIQQSDDTSVYLDLRHMDGSFLEDRFPGLTQLCRNFELYPESDLIPVHPSAHYQVGGVKSESDGATTVSRLYVAGEVASTGFHGANRLGSNSLLEGLVFGYRTGQKAETRDHQPAPIQSSSFQQPPKTSPPHSFNYEDLRNSIQSLNWKHNGIIRSRAGLQNALEQLRKWGKYLSRTELKNRKGWELQNLFTLSSILCHQALKRKESRGCHYREDYPERNDDEFSHAFEIKKET